MGLIQDEYVIDICLGYTHSSLLTSTGRVFMFGLNNLGQLGDWSTGDKIIPVDITSYFQLDDDEMITSLSMGYYHSSATTSKHRVFTWGYNGSGQLGQDNREDEYIFHPVDITSLFQLENDDYIEQIYLGGWHSFATSKDGQTYAWGYGLDGRLGLNFDKNIYEPTPIFSWIDLEAEEAIIQINLGSWTTSAVTSKGRLFVVGYNNDGRLGLGTTVPVYYPEEVDFNQ